MPIFDILIQFKLCRYYIIGLMYHDMVIYRYIIASLLPILPTLPTLPTLLILLTILTFTTHTIV